MTLIPKICRCSRLPLLVALFLAILLLVAPLPTRAQTPEQQLDALLARARQEGDVRSERRIFIVPNICDGSFVTELS